MEAEKNLTIQEWIPKILRPLEFVSKNNFINLPKTKGLEKALKFLISKAPDDINDIKDKLLELCTDLEISSLEKKKEKIIKMLNLLKSLNLSQTENALDLEEFSRNNFKDWEIPEKELSLETYFKYKEILKQPVQFLKGVGPRIAKKLAKKGIYTIEDLLFFLPRDYEHYEFR